MCLLQFQQIIAAREYFATCSMSPKEFRNSVRTLSAAEIILFQFQTWLRVKRNSEIISKLFYFTRMSSVRIPYQSPLMERHWSNSGTKRRLQNQKLQQNLNKFNDSSRNTGLAETSQVLNNVFCLKSDRHGGIQRVRSELVLMNMFWSTHRLLPHIHKYIIQCWLYNCNFYIQPQWRYQSPSSIIWHWLNNSDALWLGR